MEKFISPIGNTIFVDKVLGRNIEHARPCDPKKPYNSIYDAIKIAKSFKDAVLIKISPGIFTEPDLEISDNLTIKGSGKTATQIYTTISTRKLVNSATIKGVTIIGVNKPCILSIGTGRLILHKLNLQSIDAPIGVLMSGVVNVLDFENRVSGSTFTSGTAWKHWGGVLSLKNGVQIVNSEATTYGAETYKNSRNYILSENSQIKIPELQEPINFYQASGSSEIAKSFTITAGESVRLTSIGHKWKFFKLPVNPINSMIYQIAESPIILISDQILELRERYAKIIIVKSSKNTGKILLPMENCLYSVTNNTDKTFPLFDTKNDEQYILTAKTTYRIIGQSYKEKFRVFIEVIQPTTSIHLDIGNVEDSTQVSGINKIQNSGNIIVGGVNTIPINKSPFYITDQNATYSINSGSGIIYFPIPEPGIAINIGNAGNYPYTAIAPPGYTFVDPDTSAQVTNLDLSRYVVWRFTSDTIIKSWSTSTYVADTVNITYTNSTYKSNLKNSNVLEIGAPNVRVGISNLTLEDSEYIPLAILNNSNAVVMNNNMINI